MGIATSKPNSSSMPMSTDHCKHMDAHLMGMFAKYNAKDFLDKTRKTLCDCKYTKDTDRRKCHDKKWVCHGVDQSAIITAQLISGENTSNAFPITKELKEAEKEIQAGDTEGCVEWTRYTQNIAAGIGNIVKKQKQKQKEKMFDACRSTANRIDKYGNTNPSADTWTTVLTTISADPNEVSDFCNCNSAWAAYSKESPIYDCTKEMTNFAKSTRKSAIVTFAQQMVVAGK